MQRAMIWHVPPWRSGSACGLACWRRGFETARRVILDLACGGVGSRPRGDILVWGLGGCISDPRGTGNESGVLRKRACTQRKDQAPVNWTCEFWGAGCAVGATSSGIQAFCLIFAAFPNRFARGTRPYNFRGDLTVGSMRFWRRSDLGGGEHVRR